MDDYHCPMHSNWDVDLFFNRDYLEEITMWNFVSGIAVGVLSGFIYDKFFVHKSETVPPKTPQIPNAESPIKMGDYIEEAKRQASLSTPITVKTGQTVTVKPGTLVSVELPMGGTASGAPKSSDIGIMVPLMPNLFRANSVGDATISVSFRPLSTPDPIDLAVPFNPIVLESYATVKVRN